MKKMNDAFSHPIIAHFASGDDVDYTMSVYHLLVTEPDIEYISDGITGEVIFPLESERHAQFESTVMLPPPMMPVRLEVRNGSFFLLGMLALNKESWLVWEDEGDSEPQFVNVHLDAFPRWDFNTAGMHFDGLYQSKWQRTI